MPFAVNGGLMNAPNNEIISEILIPQNQLKVCVKRLARQISKDYKGKTVHLVSVLKGGVFFLTDLSRQLTVPCSIDFLSISSYGPQTSGGEVRITKDLEESISGKHVLIVEDIVDTGLTLSYIYQNFERRNPADIQVCSLLDRPYRRIIDIPIKYKGFDVPDKFLVGYGLDWRQQYRNLPYIGIIKTEALSNEK
jgi:hypoxanthine phosphoribosyltransferase